MKRIYGVAGDSLNGMTETIRKSNQIKWRHVRHEEELTTRSVFRAFTVVPLMVL